MEVRVLDTARRHLSIAGRSDAIGEDPIAMRAGALSVADLADYRGDWSATQAVRERGLARWGYGAAGTVAQCRFSEWLLWGLCRGYRHGRLL